MSAGIHAPVIGSTMDTQQAAPVVDFNLHGILGIRLVNPSARDVAAVRKQVGPVGQAFDGEPDITIEFVERLPLASTVHSLGLNEAGFTDDAFLVLRGKHKSRVRVQIPFDEIGGRIRITCESGLSAVPLLIPIINLTALARGVLPLHASAFIYEGVGVLATGWSKGGKTECLLAFASRGATYVGDEWVYLKPDGTIAGIPEPIRLWDWHLEQLPQYGGQIALGDRLRLRAIQLAEATDRRTPAGLKRRFFLSKGINRLMPLLHGQLHVDVAPEKLFGAGRIVSNAPLDTVLFVGSHESPAITVNPVDPAEVARRMVFSLEYERLPFMAYYLTYRFAFPERRNALIEEAEATQRRLLEDRLRGKHALQVMHPYPFSLQALFDAVSPRIRP
ncbi:MAG: hypothetical protein DIU68_005465 [Chloroflexota bacterium]|nr:MAG: hypothetical protein DIU68_05390 [Chloroflexota bacterium]